MRSIATASPDLLMLTSRSTTLAATLLLVLLFGWTVRAWRKGGSRHAPAAATPTMATPANESSKNTFPDE